MGYFILYEIFMDTYITKMFGTLLLFFITAITEILGCYFPYLILNQGKSHWLWIPTILSLMAFVWLLTLHPAASGRIYAAYGGIYIFTALLWLKFVDQAVLSRWDLMGGLVVMMGALIIILQPHGLIR
jgi:small multidrug resistance family-3 protein